LSRGVRQGCPRSPLLFNIYTVSQKTGPFLFEHNFRKYCPILIIFFSLLQTEIICPLIRRPNSLCHFTYSLLLHYLEKCNHVHFFTETVVNECAMHAVISLLFQNRKFWWYLTVFFDAASRHHNDVILTSFSVYLFTASVNLFQSTWV